MLIACTDLDSTDGLLGIAALAADLPETTKLWNTINDCGTRSRFLRHQGRQCQGREHLGQADQADRRGLPQPPALPSPHPPGPAPTDTDGVHLDSAGRHGQLQIAALMQPRAWRLD
jgi:hypothetical protein